MVDRLTLTAVFTPDEDGWSMAQRAGWPAVVTCGRTVDEVATAGADRSGTSLHVLHLCVMERVGVRELRQNLSVYLRRVRRGESLEVTERGEPVAVLQPTPSSHDPLTALAARGIAVRRGRGNLADLAAPVARHLDRSASEALQEVREDRL